MEITQQHPWLAATSGKTALVNALLHEITDPNERVILIEDNLELQCRIPNLIRKLIRPPTLPLSKAIFDLLREYTPEPDYYRRGT